MAVYSSNSSSSYIVIIVIIILIIISGTYKRIKTNCSTKMTINNSWENCYLQPSSMINRYNAENFMEAKNTRVNKTCEH